MPDRLKDRWWRLNNLYYVVDEDGHKVKFKPELRPVQNQLYFSMWYLVTILKARQHGITTFFAIYFLDACIFKSDLRAVIIAHKITKAQEIFGDKVKYAYDNIDLPEIKKAIYPVGDSKLELKFNNNSAIRVDTSARGGTVNLLLISEYGKICAKNPEKAKEIRTGALNTVHPGNLVAIESTAEGREGHYYELTKLSRDLEVSGRKLTKLDYKFFFFSWMEKPEYCLTAEEAAIVVIPTEMDEYFRELKLKHGIELSPGQKAWYVKKYETQQDEMKREFPSTPDEAFEAAVIGAYYSKQMMKAREDGRITEVLYDPSIQVHTAWDLGIGTNDPMAVWFFQIIGPWVNIIDYVDEEDGMELVKMAMDEKGYMYGTNFAPHDIGKRDQISGTKQLDRAKTELGLGFEQVERTPDVVEDINEVRRAFYRFRFDEKKCDKGLKAVDGYRKEWDEKNGCFRPRPLHNWASHGADGLRTLAHAVERLASLNTPKPPPPGAGVNPAGWQG